MQLLMHAFLNCGPQTRLIYFFNKVSSQLSVAYKLIDERSLFSLKNLPNFCLMIKPINFSRNFLILLTSLLSLKMYRYLIFPAGNLFHSGTCFTITWLPQGRWERFCIEHVALIPLNRFDLKIWVCVKKFGNFFLGSSLTWLQFI